MTHLRQTRAKGRSAGRWGLGIDRVRKIAPRRSVPLTSVSDTVHGQPAGAGFSAIFQSQLPSLFLCLRNRVGCIFWHTMNLGYARVSTDDQELHLQTDALKRAGCERLFTDKASGAKADRPGLAEALSFARKGDTLTVWRIDRLGRSLSQLIELVARLKDAGIHLRSLQENIDTSTAGGELVFHVFGAMAQFERSLIRERTLAGLEAARARGRKGGRPAVDAQKVRAIRALAKDQSVNVTEACATLGVSRATFYRYRTEAQAAINEGRPT